MSYNEERTNKDGSVVVTQLIKDDSTKRWSSDKSRKCPVNYCSYVIQVKENV